MYCVTYVEKHRNQKFINKKYTSLISLSEGDTTESENIASLQGINFYCPNAKQLFKQSICRER